LNRFCVSFGRVMAPNPMCLLTQKTELPLMAMRERRAAETAGAAAVLAFVALVGLIFSNTDQTVLLSTETLQPNRYAVLTYVSGPISAGPAAAHMDFGEPDPAAYLKDVSERGRDASIAMKSPASEHSAPYHGGVNRWREQRSTSSGATAFPTYWGTSEQDARPVSSGYEQGQAGFWGRGFGPNHNGEGKEGSPRALGASEKKYWGKAAASYDSALGHLYDAQDSADAAAWVAGDVGFYPGLGAFMFVLWFARDLASIENRACLCGRALYMANRPLRT